jgi:ribosome-associated toxin RatA of RatAB toxin-antitoxin module
MARFTIERPIAAAEQDAWPLLVEMATHLAEAKAIRSVEVVSASPERVVSRWTFVLRGSPLRWTQESDLDAATRTVRFRMTEGDPYHVSGAWRLVSSDGTTAIRLDMDFEFGLPPISEVLDPVMERTMIELVELLAGQASPP